MYQTTSKKHGTFGCLGTKQFGSPSPQRNKEVVLSGSASLLLMKTFWRSLAGAETVLKSCGPRRCPFESEILKWLLSISWNVSFCCWILLFCAVWSPHQVLIRGRKCSWIALRPLTASHSWVLVYWHCRLVRIFFLMWEKHILIQIWDAYPERKTNDSILRQNLGDGRVRN